MNVLRIFEEISAYKAPFDLAQSARPFVAEMVESTSDLTTLYPVKEDVGSNPAGGRIFPLIELLEYSGR